VKGHSNRLCASTMDAAVTRQYDNPISTSLAITTKVKGSVPILTFG